MLVLLIDECKADRDAMGKVLAAEGQEVLHASDPQRAIELVGQRRPDVAITSLSVARMNGYAFLRSLRAAPSAGHVYAIVAGAVFSPGDIASVFRAGADDLFRKPVSREELVARVNAPARIRAWAGARDAGAQDWSAFVDVTRLRAWTHADVTLGTEVGEMLGQPISVADAWEPTTGPLLAAHVSLFLASERLEIRMKVAIEYPHAASLAELAMAGAPFSEVAVRDVLREIANVGAGAVKRASLPDTVAFTSGLPVDARTDEKSAAAVAFRGWSVLVGASGVPIRCSMESRRCADVRVAASGLQEGMVLAEDVRNKGGALLIAAGTRLSSALAGRIGAMLGDEAPVSVLQLQ